ncbi:hypothetical protein PVAG01_07143 [Phlyctema vagabunda]|uniref:Uncharacterized protein n=1 Tax=Phlyctema vagabunda TaxID=108571 RepID=A0ABR4PBN3_9HELO
MSAAPKELAKSLNKLSLDQDSGKTTNTLGALSRQDKNKENKKKAVADSWEEEDASSSSGDDTDRPLSHQASADYPTAPPPTPISPTSFSSPDTFISPYGYSATQGPSVGSGSRSERPGARPEKTDAVAKRLIAGALGVKAPKKTEEQRAYDRAIKEKEIRRRNAEKEAAVKAEEEAERAKAAVWAD